MKLVIVESPTKARTIGKFLGKDYVIKASMGHVMDLPKSVLGVDIENNFTPQYELSKDKSSTITELKSIAKKAEEVILATDPDREGEAIASHIEQLLKGINPIPFQRIVFHEITKEAIQEALKNPGVVNTNLVNAQTARRVLDRLVGYKLSPVLWQKIRRGLSAGRVQSVALRLIVEREREIERFKKEEYWTVGVILASRSVAKTRPGSLRNNRSDERDSGQARMTKDDQETEFALVEINGQKIELSEKIKLYNGEYTFSKTTIDTLEKANNITNDLSVKKFIVSDVLIKESKRSPKPPFTTSTLQQQASLRLGYSGKRTMSLAQKLYEEGYITYHRTDSLNMSSSAISKMREFIEKEFGKKYIPDKPRYYSAKQKLAQEAHECIRPTSVDQISNHGSDGDLKSPAFANSAAVATSAKVAAAVGKQISNNLGAAYLKLYDLIWRRALASQMSDAQIETTTVIVDTVSPVILSVAKDPTTIKEDSSEKLQDDDVRYRFKTTGSVVVFEGFLKVNPFGLEDKKIPNFVSKENLSLVKSISEKHETVPPPRYNDASIIKSLEEEGIGRPSTYAAIISTIEARNYIERAGNKFTPTPVGNTVNDFLVKNFSSIDDMPFTASMEDKLDKIALGENEWTQVIREFYTPFEKKLLEVKKADRIQISVEETGEICPKDNAPLVVRVGKFGKFISCKNFPACDFKKQFTRETQYFCPKCALLGKKEAKILIKKTKKGRTFYACSNYPECNFAVWKLTDLKEKNLQNTLKKTSA